jgi:hypothetical protein
MSSRFSDYGAHFAVLQVQRQRGVVAGCRRNLQDSQSHKEEIDGGTNEQPDVSHRRRGSV